jgi:hypothetical protein
LYSIHVDFSACKPSSLTSKKNYRAQAHKTSIIPATFWNICTNHVAWAECHVNSLCFYGFTIIFWNWSVRLLFCFSFYYQIFVIINLLFTNFTSINFTFDIDFRNRQFNCLTIYEENRSCIMIGNPALPVAQPRILVYHDGLHIALFRNLLIWFDFWCFNATFSNISAISWRPVLVVEEAGVPGENHRPWASNW